MEPLRWQGGKQGQNRLERTHSESSEAKLGVQCSGSYALAPAVASRDASSSNVAVCINMKHLHSCMSSLCLYSYITCASISASCSLSDYIICSFQAFLVILSTIFFARSLAATDFSNHYQGRPFACKACCCFFRCPCDNCQDKETDDGKAVHDDAVIKQAQRRFKRWPIGLRSDFLFPLNPCGAESASCSGCTVLHTGQNLSRHAVTL